MKFIQVTDLMVLEALLFLLLNALLKFLDTFCFLLQAIKFMLRVLVFLHQIIAVAYLDVLKVCEFLKNFHL